MNLENIWLQWSNRQLNYVIDIIKNSDAESICEIGSFVGSVARPLWNGIKAVSYTHLTLPTKA